jgi:DNA helicase-2/ATP-dependent DNA helicase PcrA
MSNTPDPTRVAYRHLRKTGADPATTSGTADRLADLAAFFIGFRAYHRLMAGEAMSEEEAELTPEDTPGMKGQYAAALPLVRRFQADLVITLQTHVAPLLERPEFKPLEPAFNRATRSAIGANQAVEQGAFLEDLFPRLRTRQQVLRDLFSGRAARAAMAVAAAAAEDSPEAVLRKMATIAPVSGIRIHRQWLERAAEAAQVPPSVVDSLIADATEAKQLGEELRTLDATLASADPGAAETAELQERRTEVEATIEDVASGSVDPTVVRSAAVAEAAARKFEYASETGRAVGLTAAQEDAMLVQGRSLIAAGAGSGKTRVLAAKVVHSIRELGVRPHQIIATSFSKKSAAELKARILKFGGEGLLDDKATMEGFGTTHSVSRGIIRRFRPSLAEGKVIEGGDHSGLVAIAMKQVEMRSGYGAAPTQPDPNETFFPPVGSDKSPASPPPGEVAETTQASDLDRAADAALNSYKWQEREYGQARWRDMAIQLLESIKGRDPATLSQSERDAVNKALGHPIGGGGRPAVQKQLERAGLGGFKVAAGPYGGGGYRSRGYGGGGGGGGGYSRPAPSGGGGQTNYYKEPVNQWFNLGLKMIDEKGRPMGSRRMGTAISKYKSNLVAPGVAWTKDQNIFAAVYAAYEWLKKNHVKYVGRMDFDDQLIQASVTLIANPNALATVQAQYKHIYVDEAQDLNRSQHLLFGLVAGYYDPATQQPKPSGEMTADTYTFIGDDKQCVSRDAVVVTQRGKCMVGDLQPGDEILAYRNGKVVFQAVRHIVPSSWERGYKVITRSGLSLAMSPNHKLWASEPQTEEGQMAVYLMYRKDMGFRVGVTNKGKVGSEDDYLASYGGRVFMEKAERLWIIEIVEGREEALLREQDISLTYGIPTTVFGGENRGLNQERIDAIFKKHGHNGARLLEARHLSFDLPHWMSQSYTKHGRERHTIQFTAHGNQGSNVSMEWEGPKFDEVLHDIKVSTAAGDRRRLRRWFANYREGLSFAEDLATRTGANLSFRLSTPEGVLRETTASGLFVGMSIPILDEEHQTVVHDEIVSIEEVEGTFIDLDVLDASTFFANGILTSNSIYEFRGADPDVFVGMSDLVEGGAGFKTKLLTTNFRSGKAIVDAANKLIAHNTRQIPMVCEANVDRKGLGAIHSVTIDTHEAGAALAADQIEEMISGEAAEFTPADFGVAVRTNAEAYAFGVELLKKGIPFRSKMNFFNDATTKAVVAWLSLAAEPGNAKVVNEVVLSAHKAPRFWLDARFEETMKAQAKGNYLEWLEAGGWNQVYGGNQEWRNRKNVRPYMETLRLVSGWGKGFSPTEIMEKVLSLTGSEGPEGAPSFIDSLIDRLKRDPEAMDTLAEESPNGEVSDEAIRAAALTPLRPLLGLIGAYGDLGQAMTYVGQLQRANEKKGKKDEPEAEDYQEPAVVIDTVHGWKGLECKRLYVNMPAGTFPHAMSTTEEELASERRLAYVALTRGENSVTVLSPKINHLGKPAGESRFISEACIRDATTLVEDAAEQEAMEGEEGAAKVAHERFPEAVLRAFIAEDEEALERALTNAAWSRLAGEGR